MFGVLPTRLVGGDVGFCRSLECIGDGRRHLERFSRLPRGFDRIDPPANEVPRFAGRVSRQGQRHARIAAQPHLTAAIADDHAKNPGAPAARQHLQRQARDAADCVQARPAQPRYRQRSHWLR
ncbi:hypothetical protein D3C81_1653120 [compost metagenome]